MKTCFISLIAVSSLAVMVQPSLAQQSSAPIRMGQTSTQVALEQTDAVMSQQAARIGSLEAELQNLTGRIQTMQFQIGQAEQARTDLERENQKLSERLARLEGQVEAMSRQSQSVSRDLLNRPLPSPETSGRSDSTVMTNPSGGTWTRNLPPTQNDPEPRQIVERPAKPSSGSLGTIPASALPGDSGAMFAMGKNRLIAFDYSGAEVAFRAFLETFGDDPQAGEAHYWLGEALYHQGDFAGSARFFTDLLKNYPDDPRRGEGLVKLARSLREVGETSRACTFLSRLDDVDPNASTVTRQRVLQEQQRSNCS